MRLNRFLLHILGIVTLFGGLNCFAQSNGIKKVHEKNSEVKEIPKPRSLTPEISKWTDRRTQTRT